MTIIPKHKKYKKDVSRIQAVGDNETKHIQRTKS